MDSPFQTDLADIEKVAKTMFPVVKSTEDNIPS